MSRVDGPHEPGEGHLALLVSRAGTPGEGAALEALAPLLEMLGTCRRLAHVRELPTAAAEARRAGLRPIHLALGAAPEGRFDPSTPTVAVPLWDLPEYPDPAAARPERLRAGRPAALVLAASGSAAAAYRRARVGPPVAVVPLPVPPWSFKLPPWEPGRSVVLDGRHEVWDGQPAEPPPPAPAAAAGRRSGPADRLRRRVYPRLDPGQIETFERRLALLGRLRRTPPRRLAFQVARHVYNTYLRRWLSDEAMTLISRRKTALRERLGRRSAAAAEPPLPAGRLTLTGLVFTAVFDDLNDPRKNVMDLLSAFLIAFRDRPDATLVLKAAPGPGAGVGALREAYRGLGIRHRCRVAVVTEVAGPDPLRRLLEATTFVVDATHAEGSNLPLMTALAAGRPAIAPAHTAMAEYLDGDVGFVVRSAPEPARWPQRPELGMRTVRHRLCWQDLRDRFRDAAAVALDDPDRFAAMATAARSRMARHAGRPAVAAALRDALSDLATDRPGAVARAGIS